SRCRCNISADIRLVQDNDRVRAALPSQQQVTLDPPKVEVAVQPVDDEQRVDIGGDHLLARRSTGLFARERCLARENASDAAAVLERHPITHSRPISGAVPQSSADGGLCLTEFCPNQEPLAIGQGHPCRFYARSSNTNKLPGKMGVPTKFF